MATGGERTVSGSGPRAGYDVHGTRAALPHFDSAPPIPAEVLRPYLAHYGIDFAAGGAAHRLGYFDHDGERLVAHLIEPDSECRGTALVVHGYFDHVGLYGHLIRYCLGRGLAVVTVDLPGHGLSSGEPAGIDDFTRYVRAVEALRERVERAVTTPWHLFGQSMGGAIALAHLQAQGFRRETSPYRDVVLFAPLVRPYGWSRLRFVWVLLHRFVERWPRVFTGNTNDPQFTTFLRDHDPLQAPAVMVRWITAMVHAMRRFEAAPATDVPVLVLQGDDDRTVDAPYNVARIAAKFDCAVEWFAGARHHLVNEDAARRDALFAAIDRRLSTR